MIYTELSVTAICLGWVLPPAQGAGAPAAGVNALWVAKKAEAE